MPAICECGLIVSVGALDPVKNHSLLIDAFHELARSRPGPAPGDCGRRPGAGPAEQTRGGKVREWNWPVRCPRQEVYHLLRRAEVFVMASRRLPGKGEGVPTAALEALALGTPVVVSSDTLLDPVVTDREACRVFRSESKPDLVRVLGGVLDDE